MTPDPLGGDITNPQSRHGESSRSWATLNRYAYVGNNPTTYSDPSGLFRHLPFGCVDDGTGFGTIYPPGDISPFATVFFPVLPPGVGGRGGVGGGGAPKPAQPAPKPNIITWSQLQKLVAQNNESNFCDDLIDCIVFKESTVPGGFNANALGKAYTYFGVPQQARGLMQVTQGGAEIVNNLYHLATSGSALYQGLFNPAINVQVGSELVQHDYDRSPLNLWQALNDYGGSRTGAYALDVLRCVEQLQEGSFSGAEAAAHGR